MAPDDSRTVPLTAWHHELRSRHPPSQQIVLSESTLAGYPTSHLHGPYPVAQANLDSPTTQLVHPQYRGQLSRPTQDTCSPQIPRLPSLTVRDATTSTTTLLPSFRELIQDLGSSTHCAHRLENDDQNPFRDIGSQSWTSARSFDQRLLNSRSTSLQSPENSYWPMSYGAEPQFWIGSQPLEQHSLYNKSNREPTSTQNLGATTPDFSIPIPIMAQSSNGARGSHYRLPASNDRQVNSREILAHNQDVSYYSSPIHRKRKRVSHPSDGADSPSKRQTGATDRVRLDIEKETLTNVVRNSDHSLPYQSRSSGAGLTPTAIEFPRPEATEYIHDTRQTNGGEFFRDASNTIIKDSKMTAIGVQHVYMQGGHSNDPTLQWLKGHAMKGAEHDSADRDPPPRCHPGTRTTIIQNVQDWLGGSEREKNLLWLRGTAGVGKSAIVQTVAETLSETGRLGASLFFSRPNGRDNPRQVLPTLAYQFAIQDPSYREYITQFVLTNPESLEKAMNEQFRMLIVEPFAHKGVRNGKEAWVVTLDGLDECGEDPNGRRHSNDVQRDIVYLISDFVRQYPTVPLTWIIASRPETHLKAAFSKPDVVSTCWEEEVPVDSDEACEDVEKFLHNKFTEIGENYPDHIHDSPWPTHKQFLKIAHAALGLFIFAEVVVRFIGDPEVGNPIAQLECVLLAISNMGSSKNQENPLANLDAIYLAILTKIPPSTLQITKLFLGHLILLNKKGFNVTGCDFRFMCHILDISKDIGVTALRHLHSVLYVPDFRSPVTTLPRFYHTSFRDFLEDKSRSHEYFIDKGAFTMVQFAQEFTRVAQTQFSSDSPLSPLLSGKNTPDDPILKFVADVFLENFSSDGVSLKGTSLWMAGSLPDAQLQPFLEGLSAIEVMKNVGHSFYPHCWDFREKDECELTRRGFLFCTTFGSLDINWDTVPVSISRLGYFRHVLVDTTSGIETEPHADGQEVQEFRSRSKTAAPDTKVWVWGHRKSGCRVAVLGFKGWGIGGIYAVTGIPSVTS